MKKKITVITVCFNARETIEDTINSVVGQDYDNIEYIIVDGASTDGTTDIVRGYIEKGCDIQLVSEPDKGLYDAMNKGTNLATGEYIVYMNSGDIFADNTVLSHMAEYLDADIVYGNVIRIKKTGRITERYKGVNIKQLLLRGRMICHQAMFINTQLMRKYNYDLSYKITADFNFLCRCVRDNCTLRYIDRDIVIMDNIDGISSDDANLWIMRTEDDRSIKECFPIWYQLLRPLKCIVRRKNGSVRK
ncbi:MAG: glycosyltransferase [Lachnospiraceae bacterium]|nr:glycosyltransferase [Candidatus Colinaster equi]